MALSCSKKTVNILKGIASKHHDDFYCLNRLHSFRTENKLKPCKNKDFRGIVIPTEKNKTLKFNQYMKSYKIP